MAVKRREDLILVKCSVESGKISLMFTTQAQETGTKSF